MRRYPLHNTRCLSAFGVDSTVPTLTINQQQNLEQRCIMSVWDGVLDYVLVAVYHSSELDGEV